MAEKISAYIVKHGIPERLEDIPDLPYRLEGCELIDGYKNAVTTKTMNINGKEITYKDMHEKCYFTKNSRRYSVEIYIYSSFDYHLKIYSLSTRTVYSQVFLLDTDKLIIQKEGNANIYSFKSDGICNPMRQ